MNLHALLRGLAELPGLDGRLRTLHEKLGQVRQALGRIEARQLRDATGGELADHEFQVHSQWGEDGILQFLIRRVAVARKIFIEFGVQDYTEANTRFLLTNNQWSGLILDGSADAIASIQRDPIYWRLPISKAAQAFRDAREHQLADRRLERIERRDRATFGRY